MQLVVAVNDDRVFLTDFEELSVEIEKAVRIGLLAFDVDVGVVRVDFKPSFFAIEPEFSRCRGCCTYISSSRNRG